VQHCTVDLAGIPDAAPGTLPTRERRRGVALVPIHHFIGTSSKTTESAARQSEVLRPSVVTKRASIRLGKPAGGGRARFQAGVSAQGQGTSAGTRVLANAWTSGRQAFRPSRPSCLEATKMVCFRCATLVSSIRFNRRTHHSVPSRAQTEAFNRRGAMWPEFRGPGDCGASASLRRRRGYFTKSG